MSAVVETPRRIDAAQLAPPAAVAERWEWPAVAWRRALADITNGTRAWEVWGYLGWHDIRQRYRRSALGPFWITITMGVTVGSLALIFGRLWGQELGQFLPYFAIGNILWALLAGTLTDGCLAFIAAEGVIKHVRLPLSISLLRIAWRNVIIFAHNIWIFVLVLLIFRTWPGGVVILALPGLLIYMVNALWMALLLAIVSTRFRDIPPVVASVLQLMFLATPVIWQAKSLSSAPWLYLLNPMYHLLEVVRAPLLGAAPHRLDWAMSLGLAAIGWALALGFFIRFRSRIAFWL
jgi:lipopolysaccharide transport system permease protein